MMNKYAAVIITYNPDEPVLTRNIHNLYQQGFYVIIVDNHSADSPENIAVRNEFELIRLDQNYGIARALNIGMEAAKKIGAEWVLSSDQDTEIDRNLLEVYKTHLSLPEAGALCPRIIKRGEKSKEPGKEIEEIQRCPTSGFFVRTDVWERSGKYDEWMFIDYVDYDLCKKIQLAGYKMYRINSTYIIQQLGAKSVNSFFYHFGKMIHWKKMINFSVTYNHSPFRNYYYVRNALYYIYKYKRYINPKNEYVHFLKWETKKLILEKNRIQNLQSIISGYKDYRQKVKMMNREAAE